MAGWSRQSARRTPDNYTEIVSIVRHRINIPQPVIRPLDIHAKDVIKKKYVNTDPWWFTFHRRGIRREKLGGDPREMRAVPSSMVRGTLPERILYGALVNLLHMTSGVDFDFQSSQSGGRIELGGIVADFLFPNMKIIIQVQGPTHSGYLRHRKDEEQVDILATMGYRVFEIDDDLIYNEVKFEDWLRRTFNLGGVSSGTGGNYNQTMQTGLSGNRSQFLLAGFADETEIQNEIYLENIYNSLLLSIRILENMT